ncbi:gliding motility protein GldL, partial [Flavihumibacter sediminis]|nr:gliding motility protein GldL [Flavihumibacter sediminis]
MLTVGLLTEALIFIVYAFLPPPGGEMAALAEALPKLSTSPAGNPALNNLDKMMQEADITPTNLKKLSEGFNKLGTTVNQMKDVSDVVAATNDYASKT